MFVTYQVTLQYLWKRLVPLFVFHYWSPNFSCRRGQCIGASVFMFIYTVYSQHLNTLCFNIKILFSVSWHMVTWQFIHVCYWQVIIANHLSMMVANCQLSVCWLLIVVVCCCWLLIALHRVCRLFIVDSWCLSIKILVVYPQLCQNLKTASPKHFTIASATILVVVVSMFRTPGRPYISWPCKTSLHHPPSITI